MFTDDVIDLANKLSRYVAKTDLEGHESDRYGSYTNAFIAEGPDRRGTICLFNQASGPPTDEHAIRQPDIEDRTVNGIIAFSVTLRTDKDPNKLVWADPSSANDYKTGQVYNVSIWDRPEARLNVTLTGDGNLVDTGNSAYIWCLATWDEVENIPDVVDVGNYMKIGTEEPSDLDIRLSWRDILNPPWVNRDGSNITLELKNAIQGANENEDLSGTFERVATGLQSTGDNKYSVSSNQITFSVESDIDNQTSNDFKLNEAIKLNAWINIGGHWTGAITSLFERYLSQGRAQYLVFVKTIEGTLPAQGQTDTIEVVGEDVHRGQLPKWVFKVYTWNNLEEIDDVDEDDILLIADSSDGYKIKRINKGKLSLLRGGVQQAFDSSSWTSYTSQTFDSNDMILICIGTHSAAYTQPSCVRFGDISTTGGQIYTGFQARRNGQNLEIQRTSGSDTLYVRILRAGYATS